MDFLKRALGFRKNKGKTRRANKNVSGPGAAPQGVVYSNEPELPSLNELRKQYKAHTNKENEKKYSTLKKNKPSSNKKKAAAVAPGPASEPWNDFNVNWSAAPKPSAVASSPKNNVNWWINTPKASAPARKGIYNNWENNPFEAASRQAALEYEHKQLQRNFEQKISQRKSEQEKANKNNLKNDPFAELVKEQREKEKRNANFGKYMAEELASAAAELRPAKPAKQSWKNWLRSTQKNKPATNVEVGNLLGLDEPVATAPKPLGRGTASRKLANRSKAAAGASAGAAGTGLSYVQNPLQNQELMRAFAVAQDRLREQNAEMAELQRQIQSERKALDKATNALSRPLSNRRRNASGAAPPVSALKGTRKNKAKKSVKIATNIFDDPLTNVRVIPTELGPGVKSAYEGRSPHSGRRKYSHPNWTRTPGVKGNSWWSF